MKSEREMDKDINELTRTSRKSPLRIQEEFQTENMAGKKICNDKFDRETTAPIALANNCTVVSQTGFSGYVYLEREVDPTSKNTFQFRILESAKMDLHIGVESGVIKSLKDPYQENQKVKQQLLHRSYNGILPISI